MFKFYKFGEKGLPGYFAPSKRMDGTWRQYDSRGYLIEEYTRKRMAGLLKIMRSVGWNLVKR